MDASVAGSAFNTMLTKMAAPTTAMQKKMRRFGITFKDAKGNMLPLQKVLQQLNVASKKVGGNFDKVAFLAELVGLRGQKAAANLGDLLETGKLEKLTKELDNAAGSAKKMADLRMNTFRGSMLLLGSAVDAVKVKIFNLQDGALKGVIDRMTAWVGANEDLIASGIANFIVMMVDNLPAIVEGIKSIALGIGSFIALSAVLKSIAAIITIINLLMLANPWVLGIMAVVAAVALLSGALTPVWEMIKNVASGISTALGAFSGLFGDDESPTGPQVVSPQERVARSIEEQRTTSTAEVTIRDESGRAEVTGGKLGAGLQLQSSGAF